MGTSNRRSSLEDRVESILTHKKIKYKYEAETLPYLVPITKRKYNPDFLLDKNKDLIIEVKGRFTSADRKKMLLIKEQYPNRTIIMLFGKAFNKLTKKSPTTYAAWCDKNGIAWIDLKDFERKPECLFTLTKKKGGTIHKSPTKRKKKS